MYSVLQSKRARGHAGEPLPTVFQSFADNRITLRLGQTVLVVAGPGTGKSGLVLTLALRSGVRVLYFSADSDAFEQLSRAICIVTGVTKEAADSMVLNGNLGEAEAALDGLPVRFVYEASPSLDDVENAVTAYVQLYGCEPELIVVDNITNVRTEYDEGSRGSQRLEDLMDYLHEMSRKTGACTIGLHHVTGEHSNADKPIPLNGVKDQIHRVPEMILTLFRPADDRIGVSAVKQRGGPADPSGKSFVELAFDGERMAFTDLYTSKPAAEHMPSQLFSSNDQDLWS